MVVEILTKYDFTAFSGDLSIFRYHFAFFKRINSKGVDLTEDLAVLGIHEETGRVKGYLFPVKKP
jgi:hypothetical protein